MKVRLTKEFGFEMSHALNNYDGQCSNIHGHSYKLLVTIKGEPIEDKNSPKYGMLMDFGDLKRIVQSKIIDVYDHALVLNKDSRFLVYADKMDTKLVVSEYQPTCENLLSDFAETIAAELPEGVELYKLRLHETASSYAEWYREDNITKHPNK